MRTPPRMATRWVMLWIVPLGARLDRYYAPACDIRLLLGRLDFGLAGLRGGIAQRPGVFDPARQFRPEKPGLRHAPDLAIENIRQGLQRGAHIVRLQRLADAEAARIQIRIELHPERNDRRTRVARHRQHAFGKTQIEVEHAYRMLTAWHHARRQVDQTHDRGPVRERLLQDRLDPGAECDWPAPEARHVPVTQAPMPVAQ